MYYIIGKSGDFYSCLDDSDYSVEWLQEDTIIGYVTSGAVSIDVFRGMSIINGDYVFDVNPLHYVPFEAVRLGNISILDLLGTNLISLSSTTDGVEMYSLKVGDISYACKVFARVKSGDRIEIPEITAVTSDIYDKSLKSEIDGYFAKFDNGLCTIIPLSVYDDCFSMVGDIDLPTSHLSSQSSAQLLSQPLTQPLAQEPIQEPVQEPSQSATSPSAIFQSMMSNANYYASDEDDEDIDEEDEFTEDYDDDYYSDMSDEDDEDDGYDY